MANELQESKEKSASRLIKRCRALSKDPDKNMVELATAIWEFDQLGYQSVRSAAKEMGFDAYRKAMYLAAVGKVLYYHPLSAEEGVKIGWTKLKELVSVINKNNAKELIDFCRDHNVDEVKAKVSGTPIAKGSRTVNLRFDADAYARLEACLLANGAERKPSGVGGKEDAIMKIVADLGF